MEPDTGPLSAALQERFRDRIAGIFIEREPDFHVVVRLTGDRDAGTLQYQLGEDRARCRSPEQAVSHTVDQLVAALDDRQMITRVLPDGYGGYVDERTGYVVLTVLPGTELAGGSASLSAALGVPIRIIEGEPATIGPAPQQREER